MLQVGNPIVLPICLPFSTIPSILQFLLSSLFASSRTIKWDNGISKNTKIKRKWSDTEIIAKLTELGFVDADFEAVKEELPETLKPFSKAKKKNWEEYMEYVGTKQWPYGAWIEVRNKTTSKTGKGGWSWYLDDKNLETAIKKARKGCEKQRKKGVKKKDFTNSEICIIYNINGVETTNEEKIRYAEEFYKEKASESFEKNPWILEKPKIFTFC